MIPTIAALSLALLPSDGPVVTRVRSAALFKNGLAFVRREGTLDPATRSVRLERLPPPVHGTFWLTADPARVVLGAAVARRADVEDVVPALSVAELLRANVGREVTLLVGEKDFLNGTLLSVPEPPLPEPHDARTETYSPYTPIPVADLVLLRSSAGTMALQRGDVRRVLAPDLATTATRRRPGATLTLQHEPKGTGPIPFGVLYLARGLTWAPSYAIDLTDPDKAALTAKAEVLDDIEDLEGATLQFVTGFPNLQYGHVVDPIAMRGDLDAFLTSLGQDPRQLGANDWRMQQSVMANVAFGAEAPFPVAGAPSAGESAEDLFLYEQKDVTLARGERGLYPLFTVRVPYEHLYEWSIPNTIDEDRNQRQDQGPPGQEVIWHSVRLSNDSTLPWTTAPAMTMKGGALLGQDTLTYAAVGARTTVRITRAVDVQGEQAEFETGRQRGAADFHGSTYDRVTVRGELKVTNRKREAVRLEISKRIEGEVTANPGEAAVVALAKGLKRVNPNLRLTWSVPLAAGKTAAIAYEYALYVRS